jgi:hypothetical protein
MKTVRIALVLAACSLAGGCADIEPWERGDLAKPQMALDPDPVHSTLRAHKFVSREAASAGGAAEGGGCGCN